MTDTVQSDKSVSSPPDVIELTPSARVIVSDRLATLVVGEDQIPFSVDGGKVGCVENLTSALTKLRLAKTTRDELQPIAITRLNQYLDNHPVTERVPKDEHESNHVIVHTLVRGGVILEAVFLDGMPAFLTNGANGGIKFVRSYTFDGIGYLPPQPIEMKGYPVCDFKTTEVDDIYQKATTPNIVDGLLKVWNELVATSDFNRKLDVAFTLLSYQYYKSMSVPYRGYFGDNESGKGRRCEIHKYTDYRALYSTTLSGPNVLWYLNITGGEAIEDEVRGIEKDPDKLSIYLMGYKRGATVPRLRPDKSGTLHQEFYNVFGPKILAGNALPGVKGLQERLIPESTIADQPERDEIGEGDLNLFAQLRNLLMVWRIKNHGQPLPELQIPFKARAKELYKPLLQVCYGTSLYDDLLQYLTKRSQERIAEDQRSLEGVLTKACILARLLVDIQLGEDVIETGELRKQICDATDGVEATNRAGTEIIGIRADDLGFVSNQTVARRLRLLFGAEPVKKGYRRGWKVDLRRLYKSAKRYRLDAANDAAASGAMVSLWERLNAPRRGESATDSGTSPA